MKGMVQELIAGGSAGAIGVMIGNPLDVIKVRMQTSPSKYQTLRQSVALIVKNEGYRAFLKGMTSPLAAQFVINSILFGTNSLVMSLLEPNKQRNELGRPLNIYISGKYYLQSSL